MISRGEYLEEGVGFGKGEKRCEAEVNPNFSLSINKYSFNIYKFI